jgi:hypothetical protein
MKTARLLCLPLLAALAACGGDTGSEGERGSAAGEVLGGTISDDMLPLDTVTSQSPPLRESGEGEGAGEGGGDEVDGAVAPPRDSEGGPGEPPRDPIPTATEEAAEPEEPAE